MKNAEIEVKGDAKNYLTALFCDLSLERCQKKVRLDSGESGFLVVTGDFPNDFKGSKDGIISINTPYDNFELVVSMSQPPLSVVIDPLTDFYNGFAPKNLAVFLTFATLGSILTAFASALKFGGLL